MILDPRPAAFICLQAVANTPMLPPEAQPLFPKTQTFANGASALPAGADRLKEVLQALGLKSGGTLRQRAERLLLTKNTPLDKLDRKHFARGAVPATVLEPQQAAALEEASRTAALAETKVSSLLARLRHIIS